MIPDNACCIAGNRFVYLSSMLILQSVVFFELEDFICVPSEVSGNLQGYYCRGHIAAGLDEVDGLPRHPHCFRQFLLGDVLYGSFDLYCILHTSSSLHCLFIFQIEIRNMIR